MLYSHKRGHRDAPRVDPSEDAGGLTTTGEGEKHARARVEAAVSRAEHGSQEDRIDDVNRCAEPCTLEDDSHRRCGDVRV